MVEIFKYCACTRCAIQYSIVVDLTEKTQQTPIRVKMKIGEIEIEIESQEEQLQFAVEQILSTITNKFKVHILLHQQDLCLHLWLKPAKGLFKSYGTKVGLINHEA